MPTSSIQPAWLLPAWSELGQHSEPGRASNPHIRDLFADAGHPDIVDDEVAWCAAFVSASLERGGIRSTRSLLARSYLDWGATLAEPKVGAIAIFARPPDPSAGHVAFVVGETATELMVLGGNQSHAVTVAAAPKARLLGLRWPGAGVVLSSVPAEAGRRPDVWSGSPASPALFVMALAHVLEMEGGYEADPADPGGPTNFGITLDDFARHLQTPLTSDNRAELIAGLKSISPAVVRDIYEHRYWLPAGCPRLPPPLAFFHFDTAVNMGTGTAILMLQAALDVTVDGEIGPLTVAAAVASRGAALDAYADLRRQRYRRLANFPRFGLGWLARVATTLARAKALVTSTEGKTMPSEQLGQPAAKWWGQSLTIWGAVVTGLAAVLPALSPAFGIEVTPATVHTVAEQIGAIVQATVGLAGTLTTIYGRLRASQPLQQRLLTIKL